MMLLCYIMTYVRTQPISLKAHPQFDEKWVQKLIADDPSVLGLGDLVLRDKERSQPRAGRLDLLLQDPETQRRYEVEVQLGATDEAHIIRTIEYWDIEKKRYPQYDHCAVLIAEDITSRFLNIVSLFNGTIPFIALQMQAMQIGDSMTVVFTKVVDELSRGFIDDEEDSEVAPTDRLYWEKRGSKKTVELADTMLDIAKKKDPTLSLNYTKFYIGTSKDGQAFNFMAMRPRKKVVNLDVRVARDGSMDERIKQAGFETLPYDERWGAYRLILSEEDIKKNETFLEELLHLAYKNRVE